MQIFKNNKIIIGGSALVLLFVLWFGFLKIELSPRPATSANVTIGADLLKMLEELSQVRLDQTLFSEPQYLYLTDFSTVIPPQPLGRANPFAIIGQ